MEKKELLPTVAYDEIFQAFKLRGLFDVPATSLELKYELTYCLYFKSNTLQCMLLMNTSCFFQVCMFSEVAYI